nr:hypothetical protein [Candidatus Sigynarchaeota archaeon]
MEQPSDLCPRCGSGTKFHLTFENGAKTYHCCILCTKVFPVPRVETAQPAAAETGTAASA